MYKKIRKCPISLSSKNISYLDFGMMPLANSINDTKQQSLDCKRYPLAIYYYPESKLSMLSVAVEPSILFSNYVYKSGTNKPYIDHCKSMFSYFQQFVDINENDTCLDIGGNDGTLLNTFRDVSTFNLNMINVDPSENLGEISRERGIQTVTKMWSTELGCSPPFMNSCKLITSTNVFQHTENIGNFVGGIWHALKEDGIWCLEFPYWKKDLETCLYDQIYHEHIYYYLLTPLFNLFRQRGLTIIDVSEHKIHCGSLRVIIRKSRPEDSQTKISQHLQDMLEDEKRFDEKFYRDWGDKVKEHIVISKRLLTDLKTGGKKIASFGAAAKGCAFLNAIRVNHEIIDYIIDDTDIKQSKFMPGVGIEIVSRKKLIENPPDYLLILAHNFTDYIINSVKPIYKGKFINMFPKIKIYE